MGYPQRKFLFCEPCGQKRWADRKGGCDYKCKACDGPINAVKAAYGERRRRQESRAERTGSRAKDVAYMAWVAAQPCCHCGAPAPSHAHHSMPRSRGGTDRSCVPLCQLCHMQLHDQIGTTTKAFLAWGMVPVDELLAQLWAAYASDQCATP